MQKSFKRTLSLLLAVIMVVTLFTALPLTVSAEETEPEIVGTSITLNGAIGLNFYVKENGNTEYYYPHFELSPSLEYGDSQPTDNCNDSAVYDRTETYRIYTINLYAKQMTEQITFSVSDSVSETATKTTSVREYAEKMIRGDNDAYLRQQGYSAEKIAKAKDLCKAMLNYGAQAQLEFGYKTDDLANNNYSDYTAPALNAASIEDIDYSDPTGAWITESSRVYQFVNTYNWEHVYAHCVSGDDSGPGDYFENDTVVEIFPSDWTYSDSYDEDSNGKAIYLFKPAGEFQYLVFTNTPESLDDVQVYDYEEYKYSYSYVKMEDEGDCLGWKNWINGGDDSYYSYDEIYSSPVHFIDFVNAQNWSTVSVDVTTNQWDSDQGEYVDVSKNYAMTKLSEKAADGSDVYRFILPEMFTSSSNVTLRFRNGSESTVNTRYSTYNNIRYTPVQRTDRFLEYGLLYCGSSVGLLQKIGYSLFFFKLENYSNPDVYLGKTTDYSYRLDSNIMDPYNEMGYLCYPIREIAPSDLLKPIKITFKVWSNEKGDYITKTVDFSVYNYIKRALMLDDSNANNVQLKKTVTALVDYAQKAEAYFNEP